MKKKAITAVVLFVSGMILILFAVLFNGQHNAVTAFELTDKYIGKRVDMVMTEGQFEPDGNTYYLCYYRNDYEEYTTIRVTVPYKLTDEINNSLGRDVILSVVICRADEAQKEEVYNAAMSYYEKIAPVMEDFTVDDALRGETRAMICDYCAEVISIGSGIPSNIRQTLTVARVFCRHRMKGT